MRIVFFLFRLRRRLYKAREKIRWLLSARDQRETPGTQARRHYAYRCGPIRMSLSEYAAKMASLPLDHAKALMHEADHGVVAVVLDDTKVAESGEQGEMGIGLPKWQRL